MNKKHYTKNGFNHLYNPRKEGLGAYDLHYINAYKKNKQFENEINQQIQERYAA